MMTVQMQITITPRKSEQYYDPEIEEVNNLVQMALDVYVAALPETDLAYMCKFKVHGELTETVV